LDEWQRSAVELAVTIAARLVHDSIRAGDFAVEEVVRSAIELLGPRGPFAVRLHPADVTLLETRLGGETLATSADAVTVTADASIERGGCTVEAPEATVTSRLAEQLATMREELLRSLADADAGR
jgi:flagellar biosynthesis/type III secretory pathway protein FliH